MNCKICGNNLYDELDLRTLFSIKYFYHKSCYDKINKDINIQVIPIEKNVIELIELEGIKMDFDYDFCFLLMAGRMVEYLLNNSDWSIVYFYNQIEYDLIPDIGRYLLLKLSKNKLIFIREL